MRRSRAHAATRALACLAMLATLLPATGLAGCRPAEEPDPVTEAYVRANYAFRIGTGWDKYREQEGVYMTLDEAEGSNPFGICIETYLFLKLYEAHTGSVLTYDDLSGYLSEEFEPDGSLRLYDNSLHPGIEAFVDWAWELKLEQDATGRLPDQSIYRTRGPLYVLEDYIDAVVEVYYQYYHDNKDEGFDISPIYALSPQMYDELARKMADPSYEMDLLSLQRQGY